MPKHNAASGLLSTAWFVAASIALGVTLGALTQALFWVLNAIVTFLWDRIPGQLDLDATGLPYLVALLGVGGLAVGLGNRYLGYHPEPLEVVVDRVKEGGVIDRRTIPQTLLNTVAALGFGGPLGPEAALLATVGGIYFWARATIVSRTAHAYRAWFGNREGRLLKAWTFLPNTIIAISLIGSFWLTPRGLSLAFVPSTSLSLAPMVLLGLITGIVGGMVGIVTSRVEGLSRSRRLFRRYPLATGIAGGLFVAVVASQSFLVLFSGSEQMSALFDGSTGSGELLFAAGAKWIALIVVLGMGWKGGPIFPLMFIGGAAAVAIADFTGADPVVMYAAGVAAVVTGSMGSAAVGVAIALLVVPTSLIVPMAVGAGSAALVYRIHNLTRSHRESG